MRVIVAEDQTLLRGLLQTVLASHGFDVVSQATSALDLVEQTERLRPDLVLIDIEMPRKSGGRPERGAGLDAAWEIRKRHPAIAILALSQYSETAWAIRVARLGLSVGYQLKDRVQNPAELAETMRAVAAGDVRIDTTLIADLMDRPRPGDLDPIAALSAQERSVLAFVAEGLSNKSIALRLHLVEKRIESVITSIYKRLGIMHLEDHNRRVVATLIYLRSGWARQQS